MRTNCLKIIALLSKQFGLFGLALGLGLVGMLGIFYPSEASFPEERKASVEAEAPETRDLLLPEPDVPRQVDKESASLSAPGNGIPDAPSRLVRGLAVSALCRELDEVLSQKGVIPHSIRNQWTVFVQTISLRI